MKQASANSQYRQIRQSRNLSQDILEELKVLKALESAKTSEG